MDKWTVIRGTIENHGTISTSSGLIENHGQINNHCTGIIDDEFQITENSPNDVCFSNGIWDGDGGDSRWSNPLNWSNDVLPSPNDQIIIDNQRNSRTVFLDRDFTISNKLEIGRNHELIVLNDIVLTNSGVVENNGKIDFKKGKFTNEGTVNNNHRFEINIDSRTLNEKTFNNNARGIIFIDRGSSAGSSNSPSFTNSGKNSVLNNDGIIKIAGQLSNFYGQTVNNSGALIEMLGGKITSACEGGVIDNGGIIQPRPGSDSNLTSNKCNCLTANAVLGSKLFPLVQELRETRDNVVLKTQSGSMFMDNFLALYYVFSPTIAEMEHESPIFKVMVKTAITPMLYTLSILNYVQIDSEGEMIGYGLAIVLMNIGIYLVLPMIFFNTIKDLIKSKRIQWP